jgi:hypothetical protein
MGAEADVQTPLAPVHLVKDAAGLGQLGLPLPFRAMAGHVEDPRRETTADTRVHRRLGHGDRVAVLFAGGDHAIAQELVGPERHAPVDVVIGQLRLAGPHRLVEPALQGQAIPGAAQQGHRRVPVAVDQARHEEPAEFPLRGTGGRRLGGRIPHPGDQAVVDLDRAGLEHRLAGIDREDGVGDQPLGHAITGSRRADEETIGERGRQA